MSVISEREGRYLCAQHLSIAQAVCSRICLSWRVSMCLAS